MRATKETYARSGSGGFNTLATSILPLMRRILGKKGMVTADLIALWEQIVGSEMSAYTFPEKVEFLRGERGNGTLRVKVPGGAFALEVQHREKFIVEKINAYFGYNAISKLKIIQDANFARRAVIKSNQPAMQKTLVSEEEQNYIMQKVKNISDAELREKLAELGKKVFNQNR